jgi:hypothetical protein
MGYDVKDDKLWIFVQPTPFPKSKCNTTHDIVSDAVVTLSSFLHGRQ